MILQLIQQEKIGGSKLTRSRNLFGSTPPSRSMTESSVTPALFRQREYPVWFRASTEKLQSAGKLEDDWDSYGSLRTNSISLHHAYNFLDVLAKTVGVSAPLIAANSNGFICFEWEEEDKTLLVEITPRGEARYYFETPTDEDEGVDTGRFDSIKQMLTRF